MKESNYDVYVIGAGPAGYVAAIRCAQLGMKVAIADERIGKQGEPALGGTCLNVGCIPSKALLDSSERYHQLHGGLEEHGIRVGKVDVDIAAMIKRKDAVVSQLTGGIVGLMKANKIDWHVGRATIAGNNTVSLKPLKGKTEKFSVRNIIIAAGSVPIDIPVAPCDGKSIVDSTGALDFDTVPKHLVVVGAGVIGLELGSVWNRLGSEVTLLEAQEDFLVAADRQVAREAQKQFKSQGLDIQLGAAVTSAKKTGKQVTVSYDNKQGKQTIKADKVLVAVGRKPYTAQLWDKALAIKTDQRGFIQVDSQSRTSINNIYAIGDCVPGPMLAHKGSEEGVAVAEIIAGQQSPIDHRRVPWIMYTDPEIAWVGETEQSLKEQGVPYRAGMFPMAATGRALAMGAGHGFVKILGHAETDRVLGVHIISHSASELIAEAVLAMSFDASMEDIARTIHGHPTLSEAVHEAALDAGSGAIHKVSRARR